jgi:vacuolar-type H+-ATPase subunit H
MRAGGGDGIVTFMPALSDLLRRFRRLGTPPGPPAAALGVPARAGASLAAELLPVFAAVDLVEDEARAIRDSAAPEAEQAIAAARAHAARVRADGARRAESERAEVVAVHEDGSRAELARIAAGAEDEAARIASVAAARRPDLVARIVDHVRGAA